MDDSYDWGIDLQSMLPGDVTDSAKMATTQKSSDLPWWEEAIKTGVTKLIDNKLNTQVKTTGNVDPGSFAGQNGQTYSQEVAKRGTGQPLAGNPDAVPLQQAVGATWSNMGLLVIAGIAVAAFIALRK